MIGNLGIDQGNMCFEGKLRSIRITSGERFTQEFLPDQNLVDDSTALLIYDESSFDGDEIEDLSGNENHGKWDTVVVPSSE